MRRPKLIAPAIALMLAASHAWACPNFDTHTTTLLPLLPGNALEDPIIARVEVVELLKSPLTEKTASKYTSRAKVRVIVAIKGVQQGQELTITTGGDGPCDQAFSEESLSQQGYISGQFGVLEGSPIFYGPWMLTSVRSDNPKRSWVNPNAYR